VDHAPDRDDLHAWMGVALEEAAAAGANGEVPVGAVVVVDGEVLTVDVARARTEVQKRAERLAAD